MKQTTLQLSMITLLGLTSMMTQAATLNTGNQLTINSGISVYDSYGAITDVVSGSYFACECSGNGRISGSEKIDLQQGTEGFIIGVVQAPGTPTHVGQPLPTDWNRITAPYGYIVATGQEYTTSPITGSTEMGLDFSGFNWTWNGIEVINFGTGAWGAGYTDGIANFVWDGIYGHSYTLDYHTTIATGDPSGFGSVKIAYHFEGTVNAVPVPAAVWLFGSGLIGLFGVAKRNRNARQPS